MFEYNGQQFTLAEVEEAAANKKMSLDQYINQFGIKKIDSQIVEKPQPAAEIAAPAVGQTPDTELQPAVGLLESPRLNLGQDLKDGLSSEERLQKKREEYHDGLTMVLGQLVYNSIHDGERYNERTAIAKANSHKKNNFTEIV